jgi:hypothetical protein
MKTTRILYYQKIENGFLWLDLDIVVLFWQFIHAGDEWKENEEPILGYYSLDLSWDDLISSIADKYDTIRNRNKVTEINSC